jgi:hypothetical protein
MILEQHACACIYEDAAMAIHTGDFSGNLAMAILTKLGASK